MKRPPVPEEWVARLDAVLTAFPRCEQDAPWTGARWRIGQATVAHAYGGHDQLYRINFRAEADEVMAFRHLGEPYFHVGGDMVGMLLDDDTDWEELAELLTDSYCLMAPARLASQVARPDPGQERGSRSG